MLYESELSLPTLAELKKHNPKGITRRKRSRRAGRGGSRPEPHERRLAEDADLQREDDARPAREALVRPLEQHARGLRVQPLLHAIITVVRPAPWIAAADDNPPDRRPRIP